MKKLLISTATHGDEGFSIPIVEKLALEFSFDWKKNNLPALKRGQRFWQKDLNRSGPGKSSSKFFEERLAYRLINKAKEYKAVIDVHGSISNCGVFLILSEPSTPNIELAKKLDVENVVLWPSMRDFDAPLTQFIPNSLEIECGPMQSENVSTELERVLRNYLQGKSIQKRQKFFIVTGVLSGNVRISMSDFKEIKYGGRQFTPLLVDQYPGIKCYMLQKIGETLIA